MKKTLLITLSLISFHAFAGAPSEIARFINKKGTLVEDVGPCTVRLDRHDVLQIDTGDYYYSPEADLRDAEKFEKENGTVVFKIKEDEKYDNAPSECGNYRLVSYKQTVEVKGKAITIRTKIRCLFAGTMEIVRSCRIR